MLDQYRGAEPQNVLGAVIAADAPPARFARLRPGALRGAGVSPRFVDGTRPDPAKAALQVLERPAAVVRAPGLCHLPAGDAEVDQLRGRDSDIVPRPMLLVRTSAQHAVEGLLGDRYQVGVRNPRAVEPVAGLPFLVFTHLRQRDLVDLGVPPAR